MTADAILVVLIVVPTVVLLGPSAARTDLSSSASRRSRGGSRVHRAEPG
jgi:hypothetical protein